MDETIRTAAISPLRQRLIDDMNMRRFSRETQRNYIRDVGRFATFLRRSPDTGEGRGDAPVELAQQGLAGAGHKDAYASVQVGSPPGYSSSKSAPTLTICSARGRGRGGRPSPASAGGPVQTSVKISIRGAPSTPAACIPARSAGSCAKLLAWSAVGNSCVRNRSLPSSGIRITRCAVARNPACGPAAARGRRRPSAMRRSRGRCAGR